jgi:hypothetical protein
LGNVKYSEFDPKERILRANLRLQTAFKVFVNQEDSEMEVLKRLD